MRKQKKKEYDTPMVELIEARVEKGFQSSFSSGSTAGDEIGTGTEYTDENLFS